MQCIVTSAAGVCS